jgi:hypothetical protein
VSLLSVARMDCKKLGIVIRLPPPPLTVDSTAPDLIHVFYLLFCSHLNPHFAISHLHKVPFFPLA